MNSRHLVDPELLAPLDALPHVDFSAELLPFIRGRPFARPIEPAALEGVVMSSVSVPGPPGAPAVGMVMYRPRHGAGPRPCILHLHGGGYVVGSAAGLEPWDRPLALATDCVVASVDYRLAPETPYPGALEDCYAALSWLESHAAELDLDPQRVGILGESAGGGLAAALALLARDRGEYRIAHQHLIYPMLDDRTGSGADPHPYAGEFVWSAASNAFGWASLLGRAPGGPDVPAYAAPARAAELRGLPPTFIATGALDLFIDEDLEYARRLTRAGVPLELHVYPGAYHAFDVLSDGDLARTKHRDSVAALRHALHSAR